LGEFGKKGLDVMSGAIIQFGWCNADNGACLFGFQIVVLLIILALARWIDMYILHQRSWAKVDFSRWDAMEQDVMGGVRLHNGSLVDLKDCEVDFMGFDDDALVGMEISGFSAYLEGMGKLPRSLFWYDVKMEPKSITDIRRGKDGLIMVIFTTANEKSLVSGRKPTYKIAADGSSHYEPFMKGWINLRISARVGDDPLPLMKIRVRVEVENDYPVIKRVEKIEEKPTGFWNWKLGRNKKPANYST
jgi:hypothetical protein